MKETAYRQILLIKCRISKKKGARSSEDVTEKAREEKINLKRKNLQRDFVPNLRSYLTWHQLIVDYSILLIGKRCAENNYIQRAWNKYQSDSLCKYKCLNGCDLQSR